MERLVEQNKAFGILTGKLLASLFLKPLQEPDFLSKRLWNV
ncbi:hypothetical protein LEP1GSC150_1820 [Leptospira interrogans serovar Copenhageni str. LT2050]|uniref:Uncharacterized protein n=1 Tax=Leptospira interrogans serovar Copenhageni str. LT2050 TaxID=1001598 RepID=M3HH89_LEPIT|nr:hypothetical protein LEP1GSC150_1820 [Leptospira interrogans serovar Copenhageni str. LT2050]